MSVPGIEQELEFLTGIDASGTIVPVSMSTWNRGTALGITAGGER